MQWMDSSFFQQHSDPVAARFVGGSMRSIWSKWFTPMSPYHSLQGSSFQDLVWACGSYFHWRFERNHQTGNFQIVKMRFLNDVGKMPESPGCLDPFRQSRCYKVKLLLFFVIVMAKQTHAVANPDQSCCSYQNGTIFHFKLLQTSKEWVPRHTEESNWRAFMSKLPSAEEANWRDAMNQAIVGTVMEVKFLGEDGSIDETFFYEDKHRFYAHLNESKHGGMELFLPLEVENTTVDSNFRFVILRKRIYSNFTILGIPSYFDYTGD